MTNWIRIKAFFKANHHFLRMKAVALLDSAQCTESIDLNFVTNQWKSIDFLPHIGWNTYRRYSPISCSTKFPILLQANNIQLYVRHAGDHLLALSASYKLAAALKSLDAQGPQSLIPNARHQLPVARFANSCSALIRTIYRCSIQMISTGDLRQK